MKIAVCVKRVPDMEARFRLASGGTSIDETGLKYDLNEFDAWAVEAALRLKEKQGTGEVVIISLGPDAVQETIRKALSMGGDRGVQLKAERTPFDPFSIATAMADEIKGGGYDLILFGKMAPDSSNAAVGPMTAELLGLPCVTAISGLEMREGGGGGTAKRDIEGAQEFIEFPLPAVLTIDEGLNTPRYPSLKGIMAAKKKPLEVKTANLGAEQLAITKLQLPPDRPPGRIIGEGVEAVPELIRLLQTEAKVL